MMGIRTQHITIPCAQCGAAAAEITLMPANTTGKSQAVWHDRDRLERTEFIRHIYKFVRYEQLVDLFEAIAYNHWTLARELDPHFIAFVCKICEAAYCDQCWKVGAKRDDATAADGTWGTCPHDHVQIVDD
jgi:hypothetical protein